MISTAALTDNLNFKLGETLVGKTSSAVPEFQTIETVRYVKRCDVFSAAAFVGICYDNNRKLIQELSPEATDLQAESDSSRGDGHQKLVKG